MFWILWIGCLFISIGNGESNSGSMSTDYKELESFFNNLFFHGGDADTLLYFEGDMEDVHGELGDKVTVGIKQGLVIRDNFKISYPDSNTKLCSMELESKQEISVDSTGKVGLKLDHCSLLLQFSVSNKTGVTIKPETVLLNSCTVRRNDGSLSPWGRQVTQGLSNLLMRKAEEYLNHHYNSTDSLSFGYFKPDHPTVEEYKDILDTILIIV
ncbi:unnamed protein product [Nezara viridula]|uniref:Secreted protein n=1 Tax=Nezara viridula TaxID=85310 RepID=A0A9P0HP39_NEZVI|nr:unnamed protein product [Nezara viridula]